MSVCKPEKCRDESAHGRAQNDQKQHDELRQQKRQNGAGQPLEPQLADGGDDKEHRTDRGRDHADGNVQRDDHSAGG